MASTIKVDKIAQASGTPEFTIPTADGAANTFLKTDGSGVLSFGAVTTTALTGSTNTWIPTITAANALTGTANFTYDGNVLDVKNSGTASSINLYCETGNAHYIKLKSGPHASATSYTLTLPNAPPASNGLALTATTAGVASWAEAGGGKVLQVISNTWVSTSSNTSTTYALVTDSGTSITPAATSSKIWISGYVSVDTVGSDQGRIKLYNGASEITEATGTAGSATNAMVAANGMNFAVAGMNALAYSFLLSPSTTSAVTINLYHAVSGGTNYINRNHGNTTEGFSSSMTLMEIGA